MVDFLVSNSWVVWLALILVFVIVEVATVEFTFLMLVLGSIGGLLAGAFGAALPFQFVVAAVVSVLLLFTVRPPLLRALKRGGDPALSNVEALLGLRGEVVLPLESPRAGLGPNGFEPGQVKLANGETWTARLLAPEGTPQLHPGAAVVVTAIEGSTAIVVPAERTTP